MIGINNVFWIRHASEFTTPKNMEKYNFDISFIGHVLPFFPYQELNSIPISHYLFSDFWSRISYFDTKLDDSSRIFAENQVLDYCSVNFYKSDTINLIFLIYKYFYLSLLHTQSHFFRGEVINRIDSPINIIGGDPGYLNREKSNRKINKENIAYFSRLNNYQKASLIYASSKINLNITSLQFDDAVINRVIDIAAVEGFVLTDWRTDLQNLTSVSKEISYRTIEELNFKCEYYLHPDHEKERLEIANTLHIEVSQKTNYQVVIQAILDALH